MAKVKWGDRGVFFLATKLGGPFIRFWGKLARVEFVGREHYDQLRQHHKPFLFAVWHGRILLPIYMHRDEGIYGMVSEHRDGEMIAQTLEKLGYRTVRGSSTRGAKKAAIAMIRALRSGASGAVMPDGPNGPRHKLKPGVVSLSQKSGVPILLITFAAERAIRFNSWDRFTLWLPFSRCVVLYSEPIPVPPGLEGKDFEAFCRRMEQQMIDLEQQADAYFQQ